MNSRPAARLGLLLLLIGAGIDSTTGLFTRLISADSFTTAFGRAFSAFSVLLVFLLLREGGRVFTAMRRIGRAGWLFSLLNGCGMLVTIISLRHTTVANFFMIFAAAPFVAGVLGWIFLKERLDLATSLAASLGFVGIAIMMLSGATGSGLIGDVLAVFCLMLYCAVVLLARGAPRFDVLPVVTLTCLTAAIISLPLADFGQLKARDAIVLFFFGAIQLAGGNLLIFAAAKRIAPAQSGLLGVLNAAFAPLWVFYFVGERPSGATLVGGAIILGAALGNLLYAMARPTPGRAVNPQSRAGISR
jgi:drug/metabolite transporter (DMT)-like permease